VALCSTPARDVPRLVQALEAEAPEAEALDMGARR
jgi:hypothetical protein